MHTVPVSRVDQSDGNCEVRRRRRTWHYVSVLRAAGQRRCLGSSTPPVSHSSGCSGSRQVVDGAGIVQPAPITSSCPYRCGCCCWWYVDRGALTCGHQLPLDWHNRYIRHSCYAPTVGKGSNKRCFCLSVCQSGPSVAYNIANNSRT